MKYILKLCYKILRAAILMGVLALILPRIVTAIHAYRRIHSPEAVPTRATAIVFGAGLWWNGEPTPVLRDRVATAAELYHAGKVDRILMSGSQSGSYNEPQAMYDYAISLGVPQEAIMLDAAGNRTYDTCLRARTIYNIESAILITQKFHLPRALYTCDQLGIDTVGVAADRRIYRQGSLLYWNLRELPATLTALIDLHILRPKSVASAPTILPPSPLMD